MLALIEEWVYLNIMKLKILFSCFLSRLFELNSRGNWKVHDLFTGFVG